MMLRYDEALSAGPVFMRVGVPREIKPHEYRVGLTPGSVREYGAAGHQVVVEAGAGAGIGADDEAYRRAGATVVGAAAEVFASCEMIVKVKEPQATEWVQLREGQILFTYLHLAPDPDQARGLLASGCTAIAYETVTDVKGGLPLLAPMSEVAGRLSIRLQARRCSGMQAGAGSCSAAFPACRRREWSSSAAEWSARTRRAWRRASAPRSRSSTGRSRG